MDKKKLVENLKIYVKDCENAKKNSKKIDKYGWAGRIEFERCS